MTPLPKTCSEKAYYLGVEDIKAIAEVLKTNTPLTHLYIWHTRTGAVGMTAIADALKVNKTLMHLVILHGHHIMTLEGIRAMAEAIKINRGLTFLTLGLYRAKHMPSSITQS